MVREEVVSKEKNTSSSGRCGLKLQLSPRSGGHFLVEILAKPFGGLGVGTMPKDA